MYRYKAFGIEVKSEIPLPLLQSATPKSKGELSIQFGNIPASLDQRPGNKTHFSASFDHVLVKARDIASFLIRRDGTVTVQPCSGASDDVVRLLMLNNAVGLYLLQAGHFVLDGCVLSQGDITDAFLGDTGSGKTTLALLLQNRGFEIVTDGISCLTCEPNTGPVVHPGYPFVQAWGDTLQALGLETGNYPRVRAELDKYRVDINGFRDKSRISSIFVLRRRMTSEPPVAVEIKGACSAASLIRHTYKKQYLKAMKVLENQFGYATAVSSATRVYRLQYNDLYREQDQIAELLRRLSQEPEKTKRVRLD